MYKRLRQIRPGSLNLAAIGAFLRYFGYCVSSVHSLQIATALAYTTLLALVPLIAVMVSFLNALPGFSQFEQVIREFVISNFVPAFGETVDEYLNQFAGKAKQLTLAGVAFLLIIALMLMATIENAFNHIWKVGEKRRLLTRFLIYWLLLTLGPILLGAGLASTSYLLSLSAIDSFGGGFDLQRRLLSLLPFLTTSVP
ncbi:MAG: YihY family inner membrane protein [Gammaproteobacteria bacterium]|nr:YihY family inner membrane protein [Gammaproteobacteria bacterium]